MSDMDRISNLIANDSDFNLYVHNKAFEIAFILSNSTHDTGAEQYLQESIYCYHDAVEQLRDELNYERNKSFITKLKDLFR